MYSVRTTKTASLATAVQIIRYENRKKIIVKHVGSAHTPQELLALRQTALDWIEKESKQQPLFALPKNYVQPLIPLNKCEYLGARYTFMYDVFSQLFHLLKFHKLDNKLLLDLVLMRIVHPVSKLESLEYLSEMFGIPYKEGSLYQAITKFSTFKDTVEEHIVAFAKDHFHFDFSLVFYDVTTLYFETVKEDEEQEGIRKRGFSKDNKPNQPQIAIGLIVTKEGFPVAYDIFAGNTFEGKTFLPTITKFKNTHGVKTLTVVADAAMISFENVQQLVKENLSYIVGARVANLKLEEMKQITKELDHVDGASMRLGTERGLLVCDFSLKRYQKDKREMEKQIMKAEKLLEKQEGIKRTKFLMSKNRRKAEQVLNTDLIEKTKLLLGIKGYYTNLDLIDNTTIVNHYHNLWRVEKAFRIAKSDLSMRPIYHFKKQTIEAHILICFMALAICKYMELKTGKSTRKIVKLLKSITEAKIRNKLTGEIIVMRQELPEEIKQLWKTLS